MLRLKAVIACHRPQDKLYHISLKQEKWAKKCDIKWLYVSQTVKLAHSAERGWVISHVQSHTGLKAAAEPITKQA